MIQDTFHFYKPCQALQPYIRYYWVFKSDQILNTFTFPIGCPQIIFHKRLHCLYLNWEYGKTPSLSADKSISHPTSMQMAILK